MKAQLIQNVFKMMIGTSALIASTAFLIQTISPVRAGENKEGFFNSELPTKTESVEVPDGGIYGCGSGIYQYSNPTGWGGSWKKVGP